ncbi:MAG: hypothetical protein ACREIU_11415 [Planctomycetota bacterium]
MSNGERLGLGLGGAGILLALVLLPSAVFYGDGWGLVESLARRELVLPHPGYVTAGALVGIPTGARPEIALRLVSALGGALLVAGTFAGLRGLGFPRGPAAFGALLVALAPATLFFSRHVEVHALHAGCAAVAFAAFANASRGRPLAVASLLVTHASGALSAPFLLWIGASRSPERERKTPWRPLLLGALLALLFAAGLSGVQALFAPRALTHPGDWSPIHAALHLFSWLGGRGPDPWSAYPVQALLLPSGLLAIAGLVGLPLLLRRSPRLGAPLLAWTLAYVFFWAWNGFAERGGYLLPIYPALAAGAAELALLLRAAAPAAAARGLAASFLVAVVLAQGAFGAARGVLPSRGPDPFRWVEALREETGNEGSFATLDPAHASLARRYASLQVVPLATIALLRPEDRRPALEAVAVEAVHQAEGGRGVYLDGDMPGEFAAHPEFAGFLERVRERAQLREASRPPLRLWQVLPR